MIIKMTNLTRGLAQIILSKLGGNVDHSERTILCELIDNCIDNKANKICIYIETDKNQKKYLVIYDNGTGLKNIENIFLANEGKLKKKGCKNQAFLDSIAYLSNVDGEIDIISNFNSIFSRICIDFRAMKTEYNRQEREESSIDYNKCQSLLESNYMKWNDKHTRDADYVKNQVFEKIKNGGTYIKLPLHKDFNFENIHLDYFQFSFYENS